MFEYLYFFYFQDYRYATGQPRAEYINRNVYYASMVKASIITKEIAICAGLWVAEGDKVCNNEINFCNNCFELIELFDKTIRDLFSAYSFNVRIYVYTPNGENVSVPIPNCKINRYIHLGATKPYYIWRLAKVPLNQEWKSMVKAIQQNPAWYADFLTGFFAGEGNIKTGIHSCRTLRIAQKEELKIVSAMLNHLGITYSFRKKERNYYISHKDNWDIFAKFGLAFLHPLKRRKFLDAYASFKEDHYRANYIKNIILKLLIRPCTSNQLANKFNRTQARIQDILIELKKKKQVINFRVKSVDYWILTNQNRLIISKIKQKYLKKLNTIRSTKELANAFGVCWKSAFRRLKELEKLGLVIQDKNKQWSVCPHKEKVIVL